MNILSVNFGHDASLALFQSGELKGFLELERLTRIKHTLGITSQEIEAFLNTCNASLDDIDIAAISSTQLWGFYHTPDISVTFGYTDAHKHHVSDNPIWQKGLSPCLTEQKGQYGKHLDVRDITTYSKAMERTEFHYQLSQGFPYPPQLLDATCNQHVNLLEDAGNNHEKYRHIIDNYLTPCTLNFKGRNIPAFHVSHHYAHAAYGHFYAASDDSLIISHDGGLPAFPFNSGGVYAGFGQRVLPLLSHRLPLGYIYDQLSMTAGFSEGDGAGKLMGLAPYGFPSPAIHNLVVELMNICSPQASFNRNAIDEIIKKVIFIAQNDLNTRHEAIKPFDFAFKNTPLSIAIAANAQKLVEEAFSVALSPYLNKMLDMLPQVQSVSNVGGFTLNCPANTRMQSLLGSTYFNPLPGAIDTGISIGAAVAIHSLLDIPYQRDISRSGNRVAFPCSTLYNYNIKDIDDDRFEAITPEGSLPEFLGNALADGKIICVLRDRSEIGPRALGHRSILAKASDAAIRDKINQKKGRENWRPLAPICREQDFSTFFSGNAESGRFMLFTYPVTNDRIPAVTHVDGTARVQVIDESDTLLSGIMETLASRNEPPVIINTSFNVAGEPIVETPEHAMNSFHKLGFDYLLLQDTLYCIKQNKKMQGAQAISKQTA
ncbi:MAG: carbamoyltransferase C-terminal domain-containing protein [Rickettsiales bacterium]